MSKQKTRTATIPEPTEQDVKIVTLVASGMKHEDIADELETTTNTLAMALAVVRQKYNCKNSAEMVAFFLRNGLID